MAFRVYLSVDGTRAPKKLERIFEIRFWKTDYNENNFEFVFFFCLLRIAYFFQRFAAKKLCLNWVAFMDK